MLYEFKNFVGIPEERGSLGDLDRSENECKVVPVL
jgi:hypothetical protein